MEENKTENKQDVNEMLAEQQRELERIRGGKHKKMDTGVVRKVLNIIFLILAAIGLVLYFTQEKHDNGMIVIAIALVFKIIEFFIRFML